ncbi:MAG: glycosyltransferase family 2 protein, partial [Paracoccaceae bacterium]
AKGPTDEVKYVAGDDPTLALPWFDAYGYWVQKYPKLGNVSLQGGPRARCFFAEDTTRAPTLNKTPLVKWRRRYVYMNSMHDALPTWLNETYDTGNGEPVSGVLLHSKFLPDAAARARQEQIRKEHFSNSALYDDYYGAVAKSPDLWAPESLKFSGWRQLVRLRLMSRGDW